MNIKQLLEPNITQAPGSKLVQPLVSEITKLLNMKKKVPIMMVCREAVDVNLYNMNSNDQDELLEKIDAVMSKVSPDEVILIVPSDMHYTNTSTDDTGAFTTVIFAHVSNKHKVLGVLPVETDGFGNRMITSDVIWVTNLPAMGHVVEAMALIETNMV